MNDEDIVEGEIVEEHDSEPVVWMRLSEAAIKLGLHEKTLRRWAVPDKKKDGTTPTPKVSKKEVESPTSPTGWTIEVNYQEAREQADKLHKARGRTSPDRSGPGETYTENPSSEGAALVVQEQWFDYLQGLREKADQVDEAKLQAQLAQQEARTERERREELQKQNEAKDSELAVERAKRDADRAELQEKIDAEKAARHAAELQQQRKRPWFGFRRQG